MPAIYNKGMGGKGLLENIYDGRCVPASNGNSRATELLQFECGAIETRERSSFLRVGKDLIF